VSFLSEQAPGDTDAGYRVTMVSPRYRKRPKSGVLHRIDELDPFANRQPICTIDSPISWRTLWKQHCVIASACCRCARSPAGDGSQGFIATW